MTNLELLKKIKSYRDKNKKSQCTLAANMYLDSIFEKFIIYEYSNCYYFLLDDNIAMVLNVGILCVKNNIIDILNNFNVKPMNLIQNKFKTYFKSGLLGLYNIKQWDLYTTNTILKEGNIIDSDNFIKISKLLNSSY